jgi:DNA gyrase/topoisomerase IV subunit A
MTKTLDEFFEADTVTAYPVSAIAHNEWRSFAMYTVESRAIPNMIDGLKPVQRFYLYSSLVNSKRDFKKVSAVSGVVSDYGYNHGESAAAGAGQLMAAEWANNVCLVEGRGSFGTRLVQSAAAPRYTYTRLHDNFTKYIKDIELSPKHSDPEHEPPAFYIPVIPLVLVNGIKGIATGFATNILPRDPKEIVAACKEYVSSGKIKSRIRVKFPHFNGTVEYSEQEGKFFCLGVFEKKSKTVLLITEVPYGLDREGYVDILDKLEEKGDIVGYDDLCDKNGFAFEVKLKLQSSALWDDERIIKEFKLSKPLTENLTVIDFNGKLKEYVDERDLIVDFCDYRTTVLQKRIALRLEQFAEEARWLKVKMQFIQEVLDSNITFKGKTKSQVCEMIRHHTTAKDQDDCERLLKINILSLTDEMVKELAKQIKDAEKTIKYWKSTTPKQQFIDDLEEIV